MSLAAAIDPLRAANRRAGRTVFKWSFHTLGGTPITLTSGIPLAAPALSSTTQADMLLVVAGFALEDQAKPPLLRQLAAKGTTIIGVDGGPWILARAGLLDGQRATIHWEDLETLAATFPAITVVPDRYVVSGNVVTTGGAAPCIDMMLDLIRGRLGDAIANRVASAFLYDPQHSPGTPQRPATASRLARRSPKIARAIDIMQTEIEAPPTIQALAQRTGLSTRQFETRFRAATGTSPGKYLLTLRLCEAHRLAQDTDHSVQNIALATGFSEQSALSRAFKQHFGHSVQNLRSRR